VSKVQRIQYFIKAPQEDLSFFTLVASIEFLEVFPNDLNIHVCDRPISFITRLLKYRIYSNSCGYREKVADPKAINILIEKWLERVHNLEEEITSLNEQLAEAHSQLQQSQEELDTLRADPKR
jgi:hypothetical protein